MRGETSSRGVLAAFILVTIAILVGAGLLLATRPAPVEITINPPLPTAIPEPSATPGPLLVYVTGAVGAPQRTVELPRGSRVQDAINAAGGLQPNADPSRINLAAILRDGDQVHVFALGEPGEAALPTPGGGDIVYLNTATLEELMTLPRVGEVIAQRIIDYREANGPFITVEALMNIEGIGEATLAQIAPLVSLEN
ncbi:MAG: ComEA family DNA-binding protein [Anaerolineae bacterium]